MKRQNAHEGAHISRLDSPLADAPNTTSLHSDTHAPVYLIHRFALVYIRTLTRPRGIARSVMPPTSGPNSTRVNRHGAPVNVFLKWGSEPQGHKRM